MKTTYPDVIATTREVVQDWEKAGSGPLGRLYLVERVAIRLAAQHPEWSPASWDRRVREATEALRAGDPPLLNAGHGFYFARTRTGIEAGIRREKRKALRLLGSIARAQRSTIREVADALALEAQFGLSEVSPR